MCTRTFCSGASVCNVCTSGLQTCVSKRCQSVQAPQDAGAGPVDAGRPIVAAAEQWTWANFPDSACGNGTPTGLGVNLTGRSNDVMIYLMGGGACWNALTCAFAASNLDGYSGAEFSTEAAVRAPPFDRTNPQNPFKNMSYVFVPYCTGDVHAGDSVKSYASPTPQVPSRTVHHQGSKNIDAFLLRLRDTFPDAERIFVTGSSAGAFGAQLNYEKFARTWPTAQVHLLADCGQMINPNGTLSEWIDAWNLAIPSDCPGCSTNFSSYPQFLHTKYPQGRFGLLGYTQDSTLRQFFGIDGPTFEQRTLALGVSAYDSTTNAKYFVVAGSEHVMLGSFFTLQGPGNVPLVTWTTRLVNGDATWASVKP